MEKTVRNVMTRAILPDVINPNGVLFGGALMSWMDELTGLTAAEYSRKNVSTVAVEGIRFLRPIPVRSGIDIVAEVVSVGRTSMHVKAEVFMHDDERTLAADGMFVIVAIDDSGKPIPVRGE